MLHNITDVWYHALNELALLKQGRANKEQDDTMRKARNQEGRRYQEAIARLASSVIFAARSEASVYQGGRSNDSLGQVVVYQGHHLIADNRGFLGHAFGLATLPAFVPSSFAFSSVLAF